MSHFPSKYLECEPIIISMLAMLPANLLVSLSVYNEMSCKQIDCLPWDILGAKRMNPTVYWCCDFSASATTMLAMSTYQVLGFYL